MFVYTDFSSRGYTVKDTGVIFGGVDIKTIGVVALFPLMDLGFCFFCSFRIFCISYSISTGLIATSIVSIGFRSRFGLWIVKNSSTYLR